ncbi:hypothetical protein ElyMa_000961700 [Elysia marginata]|uniref:Uncharacterized protein n=1 Tax=Elysia marginata TaxID=1093978 RepID=A0AAV4HFJ6_9GAST|nr:hypothetical protein ElyMa_000961700 [Elysia marginata]
MSGHVAPACSSPAVSAKTRQQKKQQRSLSTTITASKSNGRDAPHQLFRLRRSSVRDGRPRASADLILITFGEDNTNLDSHRILEK